MAVNSFYSEDMAGMGDLGVSIFRLALLQSFFALTGTQLLILQNHQNPFFCLFMVQRSCRVVHYELFNTSVYIILFQCLQRNTNQDGEMTEREQRLYITTGGKPNGTVVCDQLGSNKKDLNHHRSIPSVHSAKGCRGL